MINHIVMSVLNSMEVEGTADIKFSGFEGERACVLKISDAGKMEDTDEGIMID